MWWVGRCAQHIFVFAPCMASRERGAVAFDEIIVLGLPKKNFWIWKLFHVVLRFLYRHQLDSLAVAWYMHCSLSRFCAADPQLQCPFALPICGNSQTGIFLFLDVFEGHRVALTCLIFFVDRRDLFLLVTE